MAKFVIEYNIHLGDTVYFNIHRDGYDDIQTGVVQDISQLPDVFVEGFDKNHQYTRWRIGIDSLNISYSKHDNAGTSSHVSFEENEPMEFVHKSDVGTSEFDEITYVEHSKPIK